MYSCINRDLFQEPSNFTNKGSIYIYMRKNWCTIQLKIFLQNIIMSGFISQKKHINPPPPGSAGGQPPGKARGKDTPRTRRLGFSRAIRAPPVGSLGPSTNLPLWHIQSGRVRRGSLADRSLAHWKWMHGHDTHRCAIGLSPIDPCPCLCPFPPIGLASC